ncbi:MAG: hypothetical protein H7832_13040 [Magnetococcus sp. DMHC-6]
MNDALTKKIGIFAIFFYIFLSTSPVHAEESQTAWLDVQKEAENRCSATSPDQLLQALCLKNEKIGFEKMQEGFSMPELLEKKAKEKCTKTFPDFQLQAACMLEEKEQGADPTAPEDFSADNTQAIAKIPAQGVSGAQQETPSQISHPETIVPEIPVQKSDFNIGIVRIAENPKESKVQINGHFAHVGEVVDQAVVKKISKQAIVLELEGEELLFLKRIEGYKTLAQMQEKENAKILIQQPIETTQNVNASWSSVKSKIGQKCAEKWKNHDNAFQMTEYCIKNEKERFDNIQQPIETTQNVNASWSSVK